MSRLLNQFVTVSSFILGYVALILGQVGFYPDHNRVCLMLSHRAPILRLCRAMYFEHISLWSFFWNMFLILHIGFRRTANLLSERKRRVRLLHVADSPLLTLVSSQFSFTSLWASIVLIFSSRGGMPERIQVLFLN